MVVIHEAYGLNDNIRDICQRFAEQGYAALGVDLFAGRNRAVCMARILVDWLAGRLDDFAVANLKAALAELVERPEVDNPGLGRWASAWAGRWHSPGRALTRASRRSGRTTAAHPDAVKRCGDCAR